MSRALYGYSYVLVYDCDRYVVVKNFDGSSTLVISLQLCKVLTESDMNQICCSYVFMIDLMKC